jgi:hypothetical protein
MSLACSNATKKEKREEEDAKKSQPRLTVHPILQRLKVKGRVERITHVPRW